MAEITISYDLGSGSGIIEPQAVEASASVVLSDGTGVSYTGYTLSGWSITDGGEVEYDLGETVAEGFSENITLYSVWVANSNILIFDGNGATSGAMAEQSIATDITAALNINEFTKTGYTFAGWATSADGDVVYADGANYTMGTESSYTLYAKWTANENTIKFNGNSATSGTMSDLSIDTDETKTLTSNAFIKTGFVFAGWSVILNGDVVYADGAEITSDGTAEITLYAVWRTKVTITYKLYPSIGSDVTVDTAINEPYTLSNANNATLTGYTLVGWCKEISSTYRDFSIGTVIIPEEDTTLYAYWQKNMYTIVYDKNGGNGAVPIGRAYYKEKVKLSDGKGLSPATEGLRLIGWNSLANGTGDKYKLGQEIEFSGSSNLTLYAMWSTSNDLFYYDIDGTILGLTNKGKEDTTTTITIPASLNNVAIKAIGEKAFAGQEITTLVINNSVETIGERAFAGCTKLANITFGTGIKEIGENAFSNIGITALTIPNNVLTLKSGAFENCLQLEELELGTGITEIGEYCFRNCYLIEELVIPSNVKRIMAGAFIGLSTLTEIILPETLEYVGTKAFNGCPNLVIKLESGKIPKAWDRTFCQFSNSITYNYSEPESP